jgi:hypothetical protein
MDKNKLLSDIKAKAKKHGVKIILRKSDMVYSPGESIGCAGYFDSDEKVLAVATKCIDSEWLGILAHEASHMEQWIENRFMWEKLNHGYQLFFDWLEGKTIVKREYLEEAVSDIIRLEKDCELRAIEKISQYNLPICIDTYSRKANAYLFAYLYFLEIRKWIPKIYSAERVWSKAPARFRNHYTQIPVKLHQEFKRIA